jgi:hypothetical protein
MLPPFRSAYIGLALHSFWRIAEQTARMKNAGPGPFLTSPSLFDLSESAPLALGPEAPTAAHASAPTILLLGWLDTASGNPADPLSLALSPGQDGVLTISPDAGIPAGIGRPGSTAARFQARCSPDCHLRVVQGTATLLDTPLSTLTAGARTLGADAVLNIDIARSIPPAPPVVADIPLRVGHVVAMLVRAIGLVVMPLGVIGTVFLMVVDWRQRRFQPVTMLSGVLLLALAARMAVLSIGDATTVPSLEFRFLAPGMAIGLALGATVCCALLIEGRRLVLRRR